MPERTFTKEDLKATVADTISLLQAVEKLLPDAVDEKLMSFFQSLDSHEWLHDLLLASMALLKDGKTSLPLQSRR